MENTDVMAVGKKLVDYCRKQQNDKAVDELYSPDIVSIEAQAMGNMPLEVHGLEAIHKKNEEWVKSMDVHSVEVNGPYPNGDTFAIMYKFDATNKKDGKRMKGEEICLYTVKDGKIVKEEFFYSM